MADALASFLVDPNSTLGLRMEGASARGAGKDASANPYSSWCPGSLAEEHWWEGWFLEAQRLSGAAKPDLAAAAKFVRASRKAAKAEANTQNPAPAATPPLG